MTSEDLIRCLAADLKPVRRLPSIDVRTTRWLSFAVACAVLGSYALGWRADITDKLFDPEFLAESAALVVLFVSSARFAFRLSVPGADTNGFARALPALAAIGWVVLLMKRLASASSLDSYRISWTAGWPCIARIIALSLVPSAAALFLLRKAAPRKLGWTGFVAVLSAGSLSIVGTQLVCAKDAPAHVLVWHLCPVAFCALLGIGAGRLFLSRGLDSDPAAYPSEYEK